MSHPILSIGEILIDCIAEDGATSLETVDRLAVRPGGAPANAAVAMARLGLPVAFCGVVGDDPFGRRLRATLAAAGVDDRHVRSAEGHDTTLAFAWKDDRGDGHFRIIRLADALLDVADIDRALAEPWAAILVGSVSLSAEPSRQAIHRAVERAVEAGIPVCFDVNMRPTLWRDMRDATAACQSVFDRSTFVKASLDDVIALAGRPLDAMAAIERLCREPARFVVLTDGSRGAWFAVRAGSGWSRAVHVPVFAVEAVDPTGAGDAFTAAVIQRAIGHEWRSLDASDVRYAAAAGALATTRRGAMASLPSTADIDAFLAGWREDPA